jgi:fused signal recognition particle receptor
VDPTVIVIILVVLAAAAAAFFLLGRKKAEPQQLEEAPPPKKLAEPTAPAAEKPAQKPAEKPAGKPEKPAEKPAKPAEPPRAKEAPPPPPPSARKEEPPVEEVSVVSEPSPKVAAPPAARSKEAPAPSSRKRDVEGLRRGLVKVREKEGFFGRLKALFTGKKEIDPQIVEQMEEVLLTSDVGVKTTEMLLGSIKDQLQKNELSDEARVWAALREHAVKILGIGGGGVSLSAKPTVVMVIGVNGVGKTTTIGKLATKLKADGKKVVLAAGDTFRAAAVQQLTIWGKRVGCEVVSGKDGANPGAVIFDAIQKAKDTGADVVLADTAGRLHTKANLMDELTKVAKTMAKALDGAPHETLLVLDATNGQNAMQQAALFKESLPISGIVLTKLDGTAKGGVILGICAEHGLPVRYVGIGERAEDLREFVAEEFVEAMLGQSDSTDAAA